MTRLLGITAVILFGMIGILALMKHRDSAEPQIVVSQDSSSLPPIELIIDEPPEVIEPVKEEKKQEPTIKSYPVAADGLPKADRIHQLFTTGYERLPFILDVTYKSKVPWLKDRQAWISDYATHYKTSRHFIGRSLHGKGNYYKHNVSNNDHFTVIDPDKNIEFYLLVDLSRAKMWFYAFDPSSHQRWLLKDYVVGLGRPDPLKSSGLLTPKGKYLLGERIAAYKPKTMGDFKGTKTEMIRVFGTRWIPFEKEISGTTAPAKGFGIHGVPWIEDPATGELKEDLDSLSTYNSDGCIRLASEDIEEIYAIIPGHPTTIELVNDFHDAKLPGEEARS